MTVGFFSYLFACAAYLVLTTLLLVSWRGRALGTPVIAASFCTALWAGMSAASILRPGLAPALLFAELLRDASWFLFLFRTLTVRDDDEQPAAVPGWITPIALVLFGGCAAVLVAPSCSARR